MQPVVLITSLGRFTTVTIRLLIADDHAGVRDALKLVFEPTAIEVVAEAISGEESVSLALALNIDIVLLDINMPDETGIEALGRIKRAKPDLPVLMYSALRRQDQLFHCRQAGSAGHVCKGCSNDELIAAIEQVAAGKHVWPREEIIFFQPRRSMIV